MTPAWIRAVVCFLLVISQAVEAKSQVNQAWTEYMLNYPFANQFNIEFAPTYAVYEGSPRWSTLSFQVTPEWSATDRFDIQCAAMVNRTNQNDTRSTDEIREMIGTRINFTPHKRILTRLLVRYEQRNLQDIETSEWTHSNRTRLRAETITPLNKRTMFSGDRLLYLTLDAEAFLVIDRNLEERYTNRYRFRAGLGYRLNYTWRFELQYMYQVARNTVDTEFDSSDGIIRIRIKQFLNKAKPKSDVKD